jgi:hypothetical protein
VRQIERFTLRQSLNDIKQNHVAQTFEQTKVSHTAADITGAN